MRTIKYGRHFKRDYRREISGVYGKKLEGLLRDALDLLSNDRSLPLRYVDHALAGEWAEHRDCHLRPNLVLVYRKPEPEILELVRLGSHSELGL